MGDPVQLFSGIVSAASSAQGLGKFGETLQSDGLDDVLHRPEVLVEHRLAVLDLGRQPAGGHGVPSLLLGYGARRLADETATGGALTQATVLDGHNVRLAVLAKRALLFYAPAAALTDRSPHDWSKTR